MYSDLDPDQYLKGQGHTRHLNGYGTHAGVRAITYVWIDVLPSNVVQMLSLSRCAVTLTRIHTLKVKVTRYI